MPYYAAAVGRDVITITAAPLINSWVEPIGNTLVDTIALDPRNKSKEDYTRLLNAHGWKLIRDWEWVGTTRGKVLRVEVDRA